VQHFLGFEEPLDLSLPVQKLTLSGNLIFGAVEQDHLVAPEPQGLPSLEQFIVDLSKQPITRHKQPPPLTLGVAGPTQDSTTYVKLPNKIRVFARG
jgi:hypothetical protein